MIKLGRMGAVLLAIAGCVLALPPSAHAKTDGPCHFGGVAALGDVAIGVPGESVNGLQGVGGVDVMIDPGTAGGTHLFLTAPTDLTAHSHLGFSVVCGDFDGDGCDDIAAGAPERHSGMGSVYVFMNNGSGFFPVVIELDQIKLAASKHSLHAQFGYALAADFDGDGLDDCQCR